MLPQEDESEDMADKHVQPQQAIELDQSSHEDPLDLSFDIEDDRSNSQSERQTYSRMMYAHTQRQMANGALPSYRRCMRDFHSARLEMQFQPAQLALNSSSAAAPGEVMEPVMLPSEVIASILEYLLIIPEGIELCPEPFTWESRFEYSGPPTYYLNGTLIEPVYARAFQYQLDRINKALSPNLGPLFVSRQFSFEALRILYGKNEFRFTNKAGWLGLSSFLHQIGPHNQKRLRKITVAHPRWTEMPESLSDVRRFIRGVTGYAEMKHRPRVALFEGGNGLLYPTLWFNKTQLDRRLTRPFEQLSEIGNLTHLRIAFPSYAHEEGIEALSTLVDKSKFRKLEITIMRKGDPDLAMYGGLSAEKLAGSEQLRKLDCSWEEVRMEWDGTYDLQESKNKIQELDAPTLSSSTCSHVLFNRIVADDLFECSGSI
ncbi:hypothetical protein AMS68_000707 [Peltaster fructicola]|uniref:F-box domain-containing protein n=1 Tax=Peltaster fructicola TaxID=286661 RepID=A0A6H0XL11_9PEZI|nr:hypothetical protein AMS68_000707 [Peltaster fructicola]